MAAPGVSENSSKWNWSVSLRTGAARRAPDLRSDLHRESQHRPSPADSHLIRSHLPIPSCQAISVLQHHIRIDPGFAGNPQIAIHIGSPKSASPRDQKIVQIAGTESNSFYKFVRTRSSFSPDEEFSISPDEEQLLESGTKTEATPS